LGHRERYSLGSVDRLTSAPGGETGLCPQRVERQPQSIIAKPAIRSAPSRVRSSNMEAATRIGTVAPSSAFLAIIGETQKLVLHKRDVGERLWESALVRIIVDAIHALIQCVARTGANHGMGANAVSSASRFFKAISNASGPHHAAFALPTDLGPPVELALD